MFVAPPLFFINYSEKVNVIVSAKTLQASGRKWHCEGGRERLSRVFRDKKRKVQKPRGSSKRGLSASRFRAHQPWRSSSRTRDRSRKRRRGRMLSLFPPPSRALSSPPFPSRTLPPLGWSIRLAHLPLPSFHPCLPIHPHIFLIFSCTSASLTRLLSLSSLSLLVSSWPPPGLLYTAS